jgi:hypothetical protein
MQQQQSTILLPLPNQAGLLPLLNQAALLPLHPQQISTKFWISSMLMKCHTEPTTAYGPTRRVSVFVYGYQGTISSYNNQLQTCIAYL